MRDLLSHYLLTLLTLSYIFGICISAIYPQPVKTVLLLSISCAVFLALCYLQRWNTLALLVSLLLMFQTGLYRETVSSRLPLNPQHIYNIIEESTDIIAIGRLLSMPSFNGKTTQAKIQISEIKQDASTPFSSAKGLILLKMHGPWPEQYTPGTTLAIRATLQRPTGYTTPGIFDYPKFLARKDIWVTGYIRSPAQLHSISEHPTILHQLRYYPEQIRYQIGLFLDTSLSPPNSSLYRALLIGDRSRIAPDILEKFKSTGTMHILAISGIHMTLLITLTYATIYWILRRFEPLALQWNLRKVSGMLCIPPITLYALLAGLNEPIIRACTISGIIIFAFMSNRPKTLSNLISLAALAILTISPQALFTASFQLSFMAFISIIIASPLLQSLIQSQEISSGKGRCTIISFKLAKWGFAGILASSAAILGAAPILIYHFHRFPLLGPIANLLFEPLLCLWALPCGLFALPFMFIEPDIAKILLTTGSSGFDISLYITELLEILPHTSLWLASPSLRNITIYYLAFFSAIWLLNQKRYSKLAAIPIFFVSLLIMFTPSDPFKSRRTQTPIIHIIEVGQGAASLIQLPDGRNILIDGGGSAYSRPSVGESVIAPFLWHRNINQINTIIITHPDGDHYNGLPFLIEHFSTDQLWVSSRKKEDSQYNSLLNLASKHGVKIIEAKAGDKISSSNISISCVIDASRHHDLNTSANSGLIIQMTTAHGRYLFPGDIHEETEHALIARRLPLQSDIMLAAHHGSATSNSVQFLDYVGAKSIISSSGASRNKFFPSDALRKYCTSQGKSLFVTSEDGTIAIKENGEKIIISSWKYKRKNPMRRNFKNSVPTQIIYTGELKNN